MNKKKYDQNTIALYFVIMSFIVSLIALIIALIN